MTEQAYILVTFNENMKYVATNTERETHFSPVSHEWVAGVAGDAWLLRFPNDIVMIVESEVAVCKHCGRGIHANPGWLLHKWVHDRDNSYLCGPTYRQDLHHAFAKAEPRE